MEGTNTQIYDGDGEPVELKIELRDTYNERGRQLRRPLWIEI
jgi:hypothetical protein